MTQGVGQSQEDSYRETLDYFSCDIGGGLRTWARSVADQSQKARVTLPTPRNPTDIKVARTWRRFLPFCLLSESYKRQNRKAFQLLFADVQTYGYDRETLRKLEEGMSSSQKVMKDLQKRFFTRRSLRVRDVVALLHLVRIADSKGINTSREEREFEVTEARTQRLYQQRQKRFEDARRRQALRLERSAELNVSPVPPVMGPRFPI